MEQNRQQGQEKEELDLNLSIGPSSRQPKKKRIRRSSTESPEPIQAVLRRELLYDTLGFYLDDIHTHLTHIEQSLQWQTSVFLTTTNSLRHGLRPPSLLRPYRYWTGRVYLNPPPPHNQVPPRPYPHHYPQPYFPPQPYQPHQPHILPQPTLPPSPFYFSPPPPRPQPHVATHQQQQNHPPPRGTFEVGQSSKTKNPNDKRDDKKR